MYIKNIDSNIYQLLKQAGLSASEQQVYLAGLTHGPLGSAQLVVLTKLPRVTVQLALKELVSIGACKTQPKSKRSFAYEMLPPSSLKTHLGKKIQDIEQTMEQLERVVLSPGMPIQTQEATGQEQVQGLIELALRCKSREWRIIAPRKNALSYMPQSYIQYFKQVRKERQITSKTLWESTFQSTDINLRDLLMRKPRYIPKKFGRIPSLIIAFDDALLIVEGTNKPTAVIIHAAATTQTFQLVFDVAWQACREK